MARDGKCVAHGIDEMTTQAIHILEGSRRAAADVGAATQRALAALQSATNVSSHGDGPSAYAAELEACAALVAEAHRQSAALHELLDPMLEHLSQLGEQLSVELEGMQARSQIGERIIRAEEEERQRLAREIHDGPAQALANIVLRAEICEKLLAAGREEVAQELGQMKLLVKESLREVRKIIFDLRPMTLDDLGLIPTLRRYFQNMREHDGTLVQMVVVGTEERLHSAIEVAVFRTVQEAVTNARRHAQATRIDVTLQFLSNGLTVTIEDDGIGFDIDIVRRELIERASFGLLGMQERVELLDGEFSIRSVVGTGTRIVFQVPKGKHAV